MNKPAFVKEIAKIRNKSKSLRAPHFRVISWIEGSPLPNGGRGTSLTFILPTRACRFAEAEHGGCSMCGYPNENPPDPPLKLIETLPEITMEHFMKKKVEGPMVIKFFTSGSFLDRLELPPHIREKMISQFAQLEQIKEIIIESRAEYVIKKNIESLLKVAPAEKITIAIGLESADDEINKRSVNKGMTWKQFKRAVELARSYGIRIKAYILLKPIFLTEYLSIHDAILSAEKAIEIGVETISINSSNIQKGTLMEKMFNLKRYRSPWLWSSLIVTKKIKQRHPEIRVITDPVAAGLIRGAHNCGKCDKMVKNALSEFSYTQDLSYLENITCDCYERYLSFLIADIMGSGLGFIFEDYELSKKNLPKQ